MKKYLRILAGIMVCLYNHVNACDIGWLPINVYLYLPSYATNLAVSNENLYHAGLGKITYDSTNVNGTTAELTFCTYWLGLTTYPISQLENFWKDSINNNHFQANPIGSNYSAQVNGEPTYLRFSGTMDLTLTENTPDVAGTTQVNIPQIGIAQGYSGKFNWYLYSNRYAYNQIITNDVYAASTLFGPTNAILIIGTATINKQNTPVYFYVAPTKKKVADPTNNFTLDQIPANELTNFPLNIVNQVPNSTMSLQFNGNTMSTIGAYPISNIQLSAANYLSYYFWLPNVDSSNPVYSYINQWMLNNNLIVPSSLKNQNHVFTFAGIANLNITTSYLGNTYTSTCEVGLGYQAQANPTNWIIFNPLEQSKTTQVDFTKSCIGNIPYNPKMKLIGQPIQNGISFMLLPKE